MGDFTKTSVITGVTGMIGIALIRKLTKEKFRIYAVANPDSKRISNIPKQDNITVVECSLDEISHLPQKIEEKIEIFFHLAWGSTIGHARNDMSVQAENLCAAVEAVKAAHELGCTTFLGAGSQAEYGRKSEKLSSDTPAFPENGYGIAKLCAGQMTRVMCSQLSMRHVWCRILSVYGPYDTPHTMVMSGILKLLDGEKPSYTKGEQEWDYLYCDDAANALYLAATMGIDKSIYCIGSGQTRSLAEYINAIRDAVDPKLEIGLGEIPYCDNQVMYLCADIDPLKRDTGFEPMVSFEEGIRRTVEWVKKYCFSSDGRLIL